MTASSQDAAAARARRSSRAPSPSPATVESVVPDSQAHDDEEAQEVVDEMDGVEVEAAEEEDEIEEPSTQSVSFEGPPSLPPPTVACPTKLAATPAAPSLVQPAPLASTSHTTLPFPSQPQHISHSRSPFAVGPRLTPVPSPRRTIDRAAVTRAIAAAMPSAAPAPPLEDELTSSLESSRSSESLGVSVRALPRPRSISRPMVTMGLAGPQILPQDGGDFFNGGYSQGRMLDGEAELPVESTPNRSEPAILVNDTPSAPAQSAPQPDQSSSASAPTSEVPATNPGPSLPNGVGADAGPVAAGLLAQGEPAAAGTTSKRERASQDEDEARKKARQAADVPTGTAAATPAPTLSPQTLGLIKLVRESVHLSNADQTKEEIIKFVSDPKGYASSLGAPLCRQPGWAFELRRATYDGVEKHDWILINSTEGTYSLKRTPSTQQVAFATSLDHVPSRPSSRQGTTQPPTSARAPSPVPPALPITAEPAAAVASAPAEMSREQLQVEYAKLAANLAAATAELDTLRPLTAELAAARASVATLTRQNKSLQSSKDSIQDDFNYMQAQYSEASSAALARAREAQAAEAEVVQLRTKLGLGLEQRDKIFEGIEKKWRFEVKRMEGEVRLLREEKRRSEVPGLMEKAALWEAHLAREQLKKENNGREGEEDDDEPVAEDKAVLLAQGQRPRLWSRPGTQTQAGTETTFGSSQAGGVGSLEYGFECEWRKEGGEACGVVVGSKDELRDHVVGAHVPM